MEPDWMRQPMLACEFCGGPGHYIAIPERVSLVVSDSLPDLKPFDTAVTCPEHRFLVQSRAERIKDEPYFAEHRHGRPVLNTETHPKRLRRSIRTLYKRLGWEVDEP